jgi:hypothetical protein
MFRNHTGSNCLKNHNSCQNSPEIDLLATVYREAKAPPIDKSHAIPDFGVVGKRKYSKEKIKTYNITNG